MPTFLKDLHNKVFNENNSLEQWKKEKSIFLINEFNKNTKNTNRLKESFLALFANIDDNETTDEYERFTIFKLASIVLDPKCSNFFDKKTYLHSTNSDFTKFILKKSVTEASPMEQTDIYMFIRLLHHFGVISDRNPLEIDEDGCLMLNNNQIIDRKTIRGIIKYMTNQPEEWQHFQCADKPNNRLDSIPASKESLNNKHAAAIILFSLCVALTITSILSGLFIGIILGNSIAAIAVGVVGAVTLVGSIVVEYEKKEIAHLKNTANQIYENMVNDRETILQEFKKNLPPKAKTTQEIFNTIEGRNNRLNSDLTASGQTVQRDTEERSENNQKEEDKSDVAMAKDISNISNNIDATDKEKLTNIKQHTK